MGCVGVEQRREGRSWCTRASGTSDCYWRRNQNSRQSVSRTRQAGSAGLSHYYVWSQGNPTRTGQPARKPATRHLPGACPRRSDADRAFGLLGAPSCAPKSMGYPSGGCLFQVCLIRALSNPLGANRVSRASFTSSLGHFVNGTCKHPGCGCQGFLRAPVKTPNVEQAPSR